MKTAIAYIGSDRSRVIDPRTFRVLYQRRFTLPLWLAFKVSALAAGIRFNRYLS